MNDSWYFTLNKTERNGRVRCEWENQWAHQYVCNYVDPSSDAFVSELRITSSRQTLSPGRSGRQTSISDILGKVQKENLIVHHTNTHLTNNFEDVKTRLVEIQLRMESSRTTDSSIVPGGETETVIKEKIDALEVVLEDLRNINEFNDDILQHKETDIEDLDQKWEGLTQPNSQLMTRLEIMNRELNELNITSEEFDTKSEAGSASTGSGDKTGFTFSQPKLTQEYAK